MEEMQKNLLSEVSGLHGIPVGAYNIRVDGQALSMNSTANIEIVKKKDKSGIDIYIKPNTKNESLHIPVILTQTGLKEVVYNDFHIGENSDVTIIAGCGIHNSGDKESEHDGIHSFFIGKNAKVKYVEKHYGEGEGTGDRILNPTTIVHMEEGSYCEMEMTQIEGVTSTVRETEANLGKDAKLVVTEKLMTHDKQHATSNITANLNGKNSILQIVSRSVAKNDSTQSFHPIAVGNEKCRAHIQCDSIIMDNAKVASIPEIQANHTDAAIIHEAAIGRINNEQLLKLETFGLDEEQAEAVIVEAFLS